MSITPHHTAPPGAQPLEQGQVWIVLVCEDCSRLSPNHDEDCPQFNRLPAPGSLSPVEVVPASALTTAQQQIEDCHGELREAHSDYAEWREHRETKIEELTRERDRGWRTINEIEKVLTDHRIAITSPLSDAVLEPLSRAERCYEVLKRIADGDWVESDLLIVRDAARTALKGAER